MSNQEQIVVNGLKQGDNWAYKHIYEHYHALLCRIAFSFRKDGFLARMFVDGLIIDIYKRRETLAINSSLRSYLIRSTINDCLDHFKLKYTQKEVKLSSVQISDDHLLSIAEQTDSPLDMLLEKELEQEIYLAVERLPVECRTVFEKSRFEGKKHQEIASELKVSVATVKYHIGNALFRLRKDLGKFLLFILGCLLANFVS